MTYQTRVLGIGLSVAVGALSFGVFDIVNAFVHGQWPVPLYTVIVSAIGVVPGLLAGSVAWLSNRLARVGRRPRESLLWNGVGSACGSATFAGASFLFIAWYSLDRPLALISVVWCSIVAMAWLLFVSSPGRSELLK